MAEALPASKTLSFRNDTDYSAGDAQRKLDLLREEASSLAHVPKKLKEFVPYGEYGLIQTAINFAGAGIGKAPMGKAPYPVVYVTGLSGCGKTLNIRQACAEAGREYVRVNITTETDEDDLLGGFRLRKGETHFDMGPVIVAMVRGAVLLIDEIDKASKKIMCLQAILEGDPVTLKKIGMTITAAPGFCIFATANTKGQGDESGKFITSEQLDEAFNDRFWFVIEHTYPGVDVEHDILVKTFQAAGGQLTKSTNGYFLTLSRWAETIRKAYANDAAENNVISTRRLVYVLRTYMMLGITDKQNQVKALLLCLNRFDSKTKASYLDLYNKHIDDKGAPTNVGSAPASPGGSW